ncbi:MAG: dephospho-CoA kinase [Bacteroidetes bacterium]|nr:dephospho-CoA kinase [Bacteroidota bacterium]
MKIIGITGGIGSGKSVVCKIFEQLKIPVYEADSAAKLLYNKYPELKQSVRELVSEEAIDKNGNINRKKLAESVFNDEEKLEILNKLVHPLVKRDFENWVESHKSYPYVLKEAAILFESGANKQCDLVIAVISPLELRIERIRQRDKKSKAEIEKIIASQLSDEELIKRSDFVIYNDEVQMVVPQVLKIHGEIMSK